MVPAAPADNPYAGLTVGEILQRHWEWNTTTTTPEGTTITVHNEYIPDPTGEIGTKIETTTVTWPNGTLDVRDVVTKPNEPAVIYHKAYQDGELTSSTRLTLSDGTTNVTGADGQPAESDVRAGIPGWGGPHGDPVGSGGSGGGATPTDETPSGRTSQVPTPDGGGTGRTFVDGAFVYTQYDNGDGTFTWTRYDTSNGTTSTATTNGLVNGAAAAARLDYRGKPRGGSDGGDPIRDNVDPDPGTTDEGGGDEQGDTGPAQDNDDPDAGTSADEGGGDDIRATPAPPRTTTTPTRARPTEAAAATSRATPAPLRTTSTPTRVPRTRVGATPDA